MSGETLCWSCRRAYSGCSWSARGVPVKGWTAEPQYIANSDYGTKNVVKSYFVERCPEYIAEERWNAPAEWNGAYYDAPICMACFTRKICQQVKATCNARARLQPAKKPTVKGDGD